MSGGRRVVRRDIPAVPGIYTPMPNDGLLTRESDESLSNSKTNLNTRTQQINVGTEQTYYPKYYRRIPVHGRGPPHVGYFSKSTIGVLH